jgi:hypothetical protein
MTYEERQKAVCQQCHSQRAIECGFVSRGLASKCSYLQDVMYGWELGQQDAKEQMMKGRVKMNINSDMDIVIKTNDMWEAAKAVGYKHGDVNLIVVPKEG